ncbi:hypothetical protein C3K47_13800 [Solitalea longa]|uniref:Uncharacterized protein n=1 Tax=Solitalea longa TaxID=2079460 RepID=A0A2S4ZZQ3_9SPHI|nr:hypothetical protein [Solitalea longa]POY35821.1 hypothetical protein C3K47_13800 [Solitalea longa]
MNSLRFTLHLFVFIFFISACKSDKHHFVEPAFYYWKTSFKLNQSETQALQSLNAKHLYIRFFDVDWDEARKKPVPVSPTTFNQSIPAAVAVIPVVFITNKTLLKVDSAGVEELAFNIMHFVQKQCELQTIQPAEIQIDCDWTKQTMFRYFQLLRKIKQHPFLRAKKLSATIRMHQVKYQEITGIPPVDKGLLMCYNMGDLKKYGDHNSILDLQAIEDFLARLNHYPLKLDVALPLFSWSVLFRNELFAGLMRGFKNADFRNKKYFEKHGERLYKVLYDVNLNGYSLKKGEVVRDENYAANDVIDAAQFCSRRLNSDSVRVILFHLDSSILKNYHTNELEKIYHSFR